ncbi:hypothetical protein [Arthrobacter sp. LFS091]
MTTTLAHPETATSAAGARTAVEPSVTAAAGEGTTSAPGIQMRPSAAA